MGSDRTGVQDARNEYVSIAIGAGGEGARWKAPFSRAGTGGPAEHHEHGAAHEDMAPGAPGIGEDLERPVVESGQRGRGRSGRRRSRSEAGTNGPEEDLGGEVGSRSQARRRRRHGPQCLGDPEGSAGNSNARSVEPSRCDANSSQEVGSGRLTGDRDSLIACVSDALPAAPQRAAQRDLLADAPSGVVSDRDDGAAAARHAARSWHGHHRGVEDLAMEPAANSHQLREQHESGLDACTHTGYDEECMRGAVQTQASVKRRRLRGKQPQSWPSASTSTTFAPNSVHAVDSAGPLRSAHLHEDRLSACGDRHGQALIPSAVAEVGADVTRGAVAGGQLVAWSAWCGRPPGAG